MSGNLIFKNPWEPCFNFFCNEIRLLSYTTADPRFVHTVRRTNRRSLPSLSIRSCSSFVVNGLALNPTCEPTLEHSRQCNRSGASSARWNQPCSVWGGRVSSLENLAIVELPRTSFLVLQHDLPWNLDNSDSYFVIISVSSSSHSGLRKFTSCETLLHSL